MYQYCVKDLHALHPKGVYSWNAICGIGLLCILFALFIIYNQIVQKEETDNSYSLTADQKQKIREGDIIFRRGFGIISDAIVRFSRNKYQISHCGIIIKDSHGFWQVVHTVSNTLSHADGMQVDKLDNFVRQSHTGSILLVRCRNADSIQTANIIHWAKYYLGQAIPFDERFDNEDSTAFFCTEFIGRVLEKSDTTIIFPHHDYRHFEPLWDSMKFEIIIYP
jgi:hypothetical protein